MFEARVGAMVRLARRLAEYRTRLRVRRVAATTTFDGGPRPPFPPAPAPVVTAIVRDGAHLLPAFLAHYRALGIGHVVLLDNGSADRTRELARAEPTVTLLRCPLPFGTYQLAMRRYLAETFAAGRWCLAVDVDELFDYPCSDRLPVRGLLAHLDRSGATAVVAQMLDLFPVGPLAAAASDGDLRAAHDRYDLRDVVRRPYRFPRNELAGPGIETLFGGVRKRVFGLDWVMLTKHPLFFSGTGVRHRNAHAVEGARVADFSAVLYHYKFAGDLRARAGRAVAERNHYRSSTEYHAYLRVLEATPDLSLAGPGARRLGGVEELVTESFVVASPSLREAARAWEEDARLLAVRARP